jgi:hypothetical protein
MSLKRSLSEFKKAFSTDDKYTSLRTITIDGHESAWMKTEGTTKDNSWVTYEFHCECDFSKGIAWDFLKSKPSMIGSQMNCLYKETAIHLRILELRQEYLTNDNFLKVPSFDFSTYNFDLDEKKVILNMSKRASQNEWVGQRSALAATFWGGTLYAQTCARVLDISMASLWKILNEMEKEKLISLEGAVICEYRNIKPSWELWKEVVHGSVKYLISLPANSKTKNVWRIEEVKSKSKKIIEEIPLSHVPTFGPDVDDVFVLECFFKDFFRNNEFSLAINSKPKL